MPQARRERARPAYRDSLLLLKEGRPGARPVATGEIRGGHHTQGSITASKIHGAAQFATGLVTLQIIDEQLHQ